MVERAARYQVSYGDPVAPNVRSIPFGSYGFYLADLPSKHSDRKYVVMLGNSVYQFTTVVERMQQFANEEGLPITFINLAQTGTGIHDHIVQIAAIADFDPDLIVVGLINLAFTPDFGSQNSLPMFRTDAKNMLFQTGVLHHLPAGFIRRSMSVGEIVDAAVASVSIFRVDWLLRRTIDNRLLAGPRFLEAARKLFPLPTLNLAADWIGRPTRVIPMVEPGRPYWDLDDLMRDLASVSSETLQVLLIRQESGPRFAAPDIGARLESMARESDHLEYVDLMHEFVAEDIPDHVHPSGDAARSEYARRHYDVILETLGY